MMMKEFANMSSRVAAGPTAIVLLLAIIVFGATSSAEAGRGIAPQWCVRTYDGANDCAYFTLQQCRAAVSATGGDCAVNPRFVGYPDRPLRQPRRVYR